MKEEPSRDTAQGQSRWPALINTLSVVVLSAVTVLGAVLLATQGQGQRAQPAAHQPDTPTVAWIPTAVAATPPPITLIPKVPIANTIEPVREASPTPSVEPSRQTPTRVEGQDTPPSVVTEPDATPTVSSTETPAATGTPWPCAGGTKMDWQLYLVQQGDTLYSLAVRHDTKIYWVIYYNCLKSDQLRTGQRLYLPPLPTQDPPSSPTLTPTVHLTATKASSPPVPQPTNTATPTAPPSSAPFPPVTATVTASPILLPTSTFTPTLTPPATAIATPTALATSTPSSEPIFTPPIDPTADATAAPTARSSPVPTATPSNTPVPTETPEPSPTP